MDGGKVMPKRANYFMSGDKLSGGKNGEDKGKGIRHTGVLIPCMDRLFGYRSKGEGLS